MGVTVVTSGGNANIITRTSLKEGLIFVGNSNNQAVGVSMSGDATISSSGVVTVTGGGGGGGWSLSGSTTLTAATNIYSEFSHRFDIGTDFTNPNNWSVGAAFSETLISALVDDSSGKNSVYMASGYLTQQMKLEFISDNLDVNSSAIFTDLRNTPSNRVGLEYASDYSANFTDRSLVDKGYIDSVKSAYLPLSGGTMSGDLSVSGNKIYLDSGVDDYIDNGDGFQFELVLGGTSRLNVGYVNTEWGNVNGSPSLYHSTASLSSPQYSFIGDSDTGIYNDGSSANTFDLVTGGVKGLTVDDSQDVSIPNGNLTVSNDTNAETILGRARIDSRINDIMHLSHVDQTSNGSFSVRQNSVGSTRINSASGQSLFLCVSSNPQWTITSSGDLSSATGNHLNLSTTSEIQFDGVSHIEGDGSGNVSVPNGVFYSNSYTVATLPSAGTAGGQIFVSDESGGAVMAFSDGTNWRRFTDRVIVS